jgi:hypothetical protein
MIRQRRILIIICRVRNVPSNLYPIRGLVGCCHLLFDGDHSAMVDTGLVGEPFRIRRLFRRLGLAPQSLKAIHFDILDGDLHRRRFARLYGFKDWEIACPISSSASMYKQ